MPGTLIRMTEDLSQAFDRLSAQAVTRWNRKEVEIKKWPLYTWNRQNLQWELKLQEVLLNANRWPSLHQAANRTRRVHIGMKEMLQYSRLCTLEQRVERPGARGSCAECLL